MLGGQGSTGNKEQGGEDARESDGWTVFGMLEEWLIWTKLTIDGIEWRKVSRRHDPLEGTNGKMMMMTMIDNDDDDGDDDDDVDDDDDDDDDDEMDSKVSSL